MSEIQNFKWQLYRRGRYTDRHDRPTMSGLATQRYCQRQQCQLLKRQPTWLHMTRAYCSVQLVMICATVKWKCAVENGNLYSFVLHCLNESFNNNGNYSVLSAVLNRYCRFLVDLLHSCDLKRHFNTSDSEVAIGNYLRNRLRRHLR